MAKEKTPSKQKSISPFALGKGDKTLKFNRSKKEISIIAQQEAFKQYLKSERKFEVSKETSLRQSKCTDGFIQDYCTELVKGHYPEVACKMLNVSYKSLGEWLYKGKEDCERILILESKGVEIRPKDISKEHLLFINVQRALHMAEDKDLMRMNYAADQGHYGAIQWKMERRYNARWGRKDQTDLNLSGHISTDTQHVILTPDQAPNVAEWKKQKAAGLSNPTKMIEQYSKTVAGKPTTIGNFTDIMD